jgi:hypothetical protein
MSDSQAQEKAGEAANGHDAAKSQPRAAGKPGFWKKVSQNIPLVIIMFKWVT